MVEKHKRRKEGFIWGGLGCPRLHYYNFRGPEQPTSKKNMMPSLSSLRDEIERDEEGTMNLSRIMNKNLGTEGRFQTQNA